MVKKHRSYESIDLIPFSPPEDMVLTNLGDSLDSDPNGFVLVYITYLASDSMLFQNYRIFKSLAAGQPQCKRCDG